MRKKTITITILATSVILGSLLSVPATAQTEEVTLADILAAILGINDRLDSIEQRVNELEVIDEVSVTNTDQRIQDVFEQAEIGVEFSIPEEEIRIFQPDELRKTILSLAEQEVTINTDRDQYYQGQMIELRGKANSPSVAMTLQLDGKNIQNHQIFLHRDRTYSTILGTGNLEIGEWNIRVIDKDIEVNKRILITEKDGDRFYPIK